MNGHALSGSRKLNHHWQSGGGSSKPNYFETGLRDEIYLKWLSSVDNFRLYQRVTTDFAGGGTTAYYNFAKTIGKGDQSGAGVPIGANAHTTITPIYEGTPGALKISFDINLPDNKQYYVTIPHRIINDKRGIVWEGGGVANILYTFLDEVYAENQSVEYYAQYYKAGSGMLSTLSPEYDRYTMYPVSADGKVSIYLPRGITTGAMINPYTFKIGIAGLVTKEDFEIISGQDNSFIVYEGEDKKIHYGVKFKELSGEEWTALKPSLYRVV